MTSIVPPSVPRCRVCRHPSRSAIEQEGQKALAGAGELEPGGDAYAELQRIARRFGVPSVSALRRHLQEHPTATPREPASEAKALVRAIDGTDVALLMIDVIKVHTATMSAVLELLRRLAARRPERITRLTRRSPRRRAASSPRSGKGTPAR